MMVEKQVLYMSMSLKWVFAISTALNCIVNCQPRNGSATFAGEPRGSRSLLAYGPILVFCITPIKQQFQKGYTMCMTQTVGFLIAFTLLIHYY